MAMRAETNELSRFRRLAVRHGLSPGVLHASRFADFAVVMAAAALAIDAKREYSEAEVNALLKAWLAGAGAMLATDHVELRRWLVDCCLVSRDGFGRRYARAATPPAFATALEDLAGVDLAAIVREARSADAVSRAERKARWESTQDPSHAPRR